MSVAENLIQLKNQIPAHVTLVAVSKTHPADAVMEAYNAGQRIFGENKVQEMTAKYEIMPKDIDWHLIGHLQSNKVKYIAPFVAMIHSVDSIKLLSEINKQAQKQNRIIPCLLQIFIASEETKFGMDAREAEDLLISKEFSELKNIQIAGLMGMASNTENEEQIRIEFRNLKKVFSYLKSSLGNKENLHLNTLSFGMSSDWKIAIEEGSTMVRIGSTIFGNRNYAQ